MHCNASHLTTKLLDAQCSSWIPKSRRTTTTAHTDNRLQLDAQGQHSWRPSQLPALSPTCVFNDWDLPIKTIYRPRCVHSFSGQKWLDQNIHQEGVRHRGHQADKLLLSEKSWNLTADRVNSEDIKWLGQAHSVWLYLGMGVH